MLRLALFPTLACCVFALSACAPLPHGQRGTPANTEQTAEQIEQNKLRQARHIAAEKKAYEFRTENIAQVMRLICTDRVYSPYYSHTPCLPSGIKPRHLADKRDVTDEERRVADVVFARLNELNRVTRQQMKDSGVEALAQKAIHSEKVTVPRILALQKDFMEKPMKWGEYNRRRLAVFKAGQQKTKNSGDSPKSPEKPVQF